MLDGRTSDGGLSSRSTCWHLPLLNSTGPRVHNIASARHNEESSPDSNELPCSFLLCLLCGTAVCGAA
ncbi:hypothetical protein VTN96DRAFT_7486 [Rasamsonia emersonii]